MNIEKGIILIKESYQEILETDCNNKCEDKKGTTVAIFVTARRRCQ